MEDDDALRGFVAEALGAAGFEVISVPLAEQLPKALRSSTPAIIVLDLGMPHGTIQGMEALANLRDDEAWRAIPVVILSAYADIVNREVTSGLGVAAVMSKPLLDIEDLIEVIRQNVR